MDFFLSDLFKNKEVDKKFIRKKDPALQEINEYFEKKYDNLEELVPCTPEWKHVWQTHPEMQEKMIEASKNKVIWCPDKEQRIDFLICYKRREDCSICFQKKNST